MALLANVHLNDNVHAAFMAATNGSHELMEKIIGIGTEIFTAGSEAGATLNGDEFIHLKLGVKQAANIAEVAAQHGCGFNEAALLMLEDFKHNENPLQQENGGGNAS